MHQNLATDEGKRGAEMDNKGEGRRDGEGDGGVRWKGRRRVGKGGETKVAYSPCR